MANLPDNVGDPWLQDIILSYFEINHCLSFGSIFTVRSISLENHSWELNSDLPCEICFLTDLRAEYVKKKISLPHPFQSLHQFQTHGLESCLA